ncbi:MAG: serine hydrolase, partial [Polyangiaceae bacterium]
ATTSATAAIPPPRAPEPELAKRLRAGDPRWTAWLDRAEELRLQILVRPLSPEAPAQRYRVDAEYVYPASAIKLFLAVAALNILNEKVEGELPWNTRFMRCRDDKGGCEPPREDIDESVPETEDGKRKHQKLRVGLEIQKLLSWSDNDAYNRLWDMVGHAEANAEMARLGFSSVRLHHKMNAKPELSLKTLRVTLLPPGMRGVVSKRRVSDTALAPTDAARLLVGKAYNDEGKLVEEPLDFGTKNYASLEDLQRLLLSVVRPDHPDAVALRLTDDQRAQLVKAMTRDPTHPAAAEHGPLLPGVVEALGKDNLRYISKSGRAYGFHLENAYLENTSNGHAALVTAVVYANPNAVLNDDDYAYDETSRPLLASLGEELARRLLR